MQPEKLICLWQYSNSGKTETINRLTGLMIADDAQIILCERTDKNSKDNRFILAYKNKKICITTRGDAFKYIEEDFKIFEDNFPTEKPFLFICASHIKDSGVHFLQNYIDKENIYWFGKALLSCQEQNKSPELEKIRSRINFCDAENILFFINELIDKDGAI